MRSASIFDRSRMSLKGEQVATRAEHAVERLGILL
jgi:hypothetical protein